jgi:hypothetical protein
MARDLRPASDREEWFGGRRWTGYGAVVVLALIVVLAGFVFWPRGDPGGQGGATATSTAAPVSTDAGDSPAQSPSATLPAADQTVPTSAPKDVSWQLFHTLAVPTSPTAGPTRVQGQVASGFAHTPTGALIAAAQAQGRKAAALDPGWRDVVTRMIAPGPGRDAWIKNREKITVSAEPAPGSFAQIAGFQFVSYTPSDAVIQMVGDSAGLLNVVNLHVTWLEGDWKLVLAPDGGVASSKQQVTSLAGFVAWGGV